MKNSKIFLSFLVTFFFFSENAFTQTPKTVSIMFEVQGKNINFANGVQFKLIIKNKEVQPLMYINGFVVPDFKGAEQVDVWFVYKSKNYFFKGIPVVKFETNWVFGINSSHKNKKGKKEYYIKFIPYDGGDGTQVTITE